MTLKIICKKSNPPLGALLAAGYINASHPNSIRVEWSETQNSVENSSHKIACETSVDILRAIARISNENSLYGLSVLEKSQVDHWLCYTLRPLASTNEFNAVVTNLNNVLGPVTFLVGKQISIADLAVFSSLFTNKKWTALLSKKAAPVHLTRWYTYLETQDFVKNVINSLSPEVLDCMKKLAEEMPSQNEQTGRSKEGKFVDLPGAEMGKVVVRFPPEASGYLHIGHAKAALLNQYYQQEFNGKLIMRFDDTNPAKEDTHFEEVILEDVALLEIKPDIFSYTSDYFELMLKYCEKMLKDGNAYVDDTDPEVMKQEREQKVESANRNNDITKNMKMWEEMLNGTTYGQKCCVRAKIDMNSLNGCLRDPTIYRCKNEAHPRTGTKYKVYPTYDFACPIVDSIEGVTHTLRTMEYHDRDPQFYWFIDVLGLRKPYIWEYSRLSMTNTVLSKRKLTWFVEQGLVDGWDDPRMPTVRGVLRRGMTVKGLKEFIIAQGSSRSVVFMEWDKIWAFNKKIIDPIAPLYTVVDYDNVPVIVKGAKEECLMVPKHPKNSDVGTKSVWVGPRILIDRADAESLKEGENATFINWGNLLIKKIIRETGKVILIEAQPNLENKDYKKTMKVTFLCDTPKAKITPTFCVYFDHIISKPLLGKDEDFKNYIGHETRRDVQVLGDPELRNLKQGDIIQIQRRGFFRVDVPYGERSPFTCKERPVILFYVPNGSTKENPFSSIQGKGETSVKKEPSPVDKRRIEPVTTAQSSNITSAVALNEEIVKQGNIVRDLKAKKADKKDVEAAVKTLLGLKADYAKVAGSEWKPNCIPPTSVPKKNEISIDVGKNIASRCGKEENPVTTVSSSIVTSAVALNEEIIKQGNIVRDLKAKKADKKDVEAAVKILLGLKAEYAKVAGSEWKPNCTPPTSAPKKCEKSVDDLCQKIAAQGDKVRQLKSQKSDKSQIDSEVKILLALKADYKAQTGKDWTPVAVAPSPSGGGDGESAVLQKITAQGDKVRQLKGNKAGKPEIEAEVKILLALKEEYKTLTGKTWTPDVAVPQNSTTITNDADADSILCRISEQGDKVRKLKSEKAEKDEIDAEVKILLNLKSEFKTVTGKDWKPDMKPAASQSVENKENAVTCSKKINKNELKSKTIAQGSNVVKDAKAKKTDKKEDSVVKKQTRLGLEANKEEDLPNWYSQVITKSELIEYYDVSGCYIYRPWSYAIWEVIKNWFDAEIKKLGVENCYFPIFVSKAMLEKEKSHIADFSPEVAWVTRSGDSEMSEPIAIRPTSETVMYPAYAKWIQSYRDLPMKLNQWNNVVRWEFKHPQPFLRTREFLWQEGHTTFATYEEATEEVSIILDLYAKIYTDLLAVPVVKGRKTEKEKFAGSMHTYTVEAYISASGRAIQGATSHHLGQNFSKMFEIVYEDPDTQEKKYVYQNSWGLTTRTIGVMIMVHSDNQGLVLPPNIAKIQVIIVPCGITANFPEDKRKALQQACDNLENELKSEGIKAEGDYRTNYSPGWKFNHWELKGVPIRVELGPKDIEKNQLVAVRRDTGEKLTISMKDAKSSLKDLLRQIHDNLYARASEDLKNHLVVFKEWSQFVPNLEKKMLNLVPFCGDKDCEENIKTDSTRDDVGATEAAGPLSGAKSLCIPFDQPAAIETNDKCIHPKCSRKPTNYVLFGRSY